LFFVEIEMQIPTYLEMILVKSAVFEKEKKVESDAKKIVASTNSVITALNEQCVRNFLLT